LKLLTIEEIDEVSGGDGMEWAIGWASGIVGSASLVILTAAGAPIGVGALVAVASTYFLYRVGNAVYQIAR
jgi:hypothetical protein